MGAALTKSEPAGPSEWLPVMSIDQAIGRYKQMVQFVREALIDGTDYGKIPGTGEKAKATLLKPGAEKLCTFFGLRKVPVLLEKEEDWTGERHGGEAFFYYAYRYELYRGDVMIAAADGSCNSWEKKYRWRQGERLCPNCGQPAIRKSKYPPRDNPEAAPGWYCHNKAGGCGANFDAGDPAIEGQQVGRVPNADPADAVNTIQKMAQKRALIAATLLAVNASDYFTQDLEDQLPDEHGEVIDGPPVRHVPTTPKSAAKTAPSKPANGHHQGGPQPPANGLELRQRLGAYGEKLAKEKVCAPGALVSHVARTGTDQGWSDDISTWDSPEQIAFAAAETKRFEASCRSAPKHAAPAMPGVAFFNRLEEMDKQLYADGVLLKDEDPGRDERGLYRKRVIDKLDQERRCGSEASRWSAEDVERGREIAAELLSELCPA